MARSEFVLGNKIIDELIAQGIADRNTQRVIIDIPVDGFPILYIQKIGTVGLVNLMTLLGGLKLDKILINTAVVKFDSDEHK